MASCGGRKVQSQRWRLIAAQAEGSPGAGRTARRHGAAPALHPAAWQPHGRAAPRRLGVKGSGTHFTVAWSSSSSSDSCMAATRAVLCRRHLSPAVRQARCTCSSACSWLRATKGVSARHGPGEGSCAPLLVLVLCQLADTARPAGWSLVCAARTVMRHGHTPGWSQRSLSG